MNPNRFLRIIAGSLCLIVAILRISFLFLNFGGAIIYTAFYLNFTEAVDIIEGLLKILFAIIFTIIVTIVAVIIYIVLGILQIVLSKYRTVSIICNVFITISILLSIRAIALFAIADEFSIILTTLSTLYIIIFSLYISSYVKFSKQD